MSAGLISLSLEPKLTAPELELPPFTILVVALLSGDPSTIINGSLLPNMVLAPRIRILLPAPGSPLVRTTLSPAAFPLNALAMVGSPDLPTAWVLTIEDVDPCLSRLSVKPNAVTRNSPSYSLGPTEKLITS